MACIKLVRLMLSASVSSSLHVDQLDVKGAFQHALPPEGDDIWITLPKNRELQLLTVVPVSFENRWTAYDMSANCGTQCCRRYFEICFRRLKYSDCLFNGCSSWQPVYIFAYMGYLLIIEDQNAVSNAKKRIGKRVKVSELGSCSNFLVLNIYWSKDGVLLSHTAYRRKIIYRVNLTDR